MQANEINVVVFWVCVVIGIIVYAAIIWSLVAYRKSRKQEAAFHKHTVTEIAWTVIPLLIIIAMTIPAAKVLTKLYSGDGEMQDGGLQSLQGPPGQALVRLNSPGRLAGPMESDLTSI